MGKNAKEYAFVNLRYKQPGQSQSILLSQPIAVGSKALNQASADTRFALAVAAYGQQLRSPEYNAAMQWNDIIDLAQSAQKQDAFGLRAEFVDLIKKAKKLSSNQPIQKTINKSQ